MELSGGEIVAKRSSSGAGEDRISALPDDVLIPILLCLDTAADAGRTSVLSRRWRRLWALLPELRFLADPHRIPAALAAHEAVLRCLLVGTLDAAPEPVGAWLTVAARRLSGCLIFANRTPERHADGVEEEEEEKGAFELPCFDRATALFFNLGFLSLAVPPAGVFSRLAELSLNRVRFHGPCELGDAVSSPRCPCLQMLSVRDAQGLVNLTIHSESLLEVHLLKLDGLQQVTVVAPVLNELQLSNCFGHGPPVANISTPQLEWLEWLDWYDPSSVQLGIGETAQLRALIASNFLVYGPHHCRNSHSIVTLFERIRVVRVLCMTLHYLHNIGSFQYLMEELTVLPRHMFLSLMIINKGHVFGASVFHVLRMCIGLKGLLLVLHADSDLEAHSACPSGCICDEPVNWKTEELTLNCLQEVEIHDMKGVDHEVAFLKRFFNWATVVETVSITFDYSVSERKARELCRRLSSFSRPETRMEFYMYHNVSKKSWYLLAPDQDHGV